MTFMLHVPQVNSVSLDLTINVGESLFVLGANGTGKSTLMHRFYSAHHENARRISAHRQTWFSSNAISLSPEQKRNAEENIKNNDYGSEARWMDPNAAQRASIAIYELVDAENVRARQITKAMDSENVELAKTLSKKDAPIKIINELLRLSSLPIEISVGQNQEVLASKLGNIPYSIAQLSDGERNALLIAANVLTVKPGTLLLIDEPERHLHRSIISPLLTLLFAKRPDCAFIVSTHEVMLPLDHSNSRMLLIRSCTYVNSATSTWEADLICPTATIDDELKRDILGARRKILFIEGTQQSLDKPLYSLVFPNVSVIAKSSCRDVEHAVSGIRDADDLHWLHAFGIVDNDRRTQADIDKLKQKGIYAVSVFSVESIYYHPNILQRVAERHASVTGEDADTLLGNAKAAAIEVVSSHIQRLSERVAERAVREEILRRLPRRQEIAAATPINISIDIATIVAEEQRRLQEALNNSNLLLVISHYPIRETGALTRLANALGFQDRTQYESAVRKLLIDNEEALVFVKSLFGTLDTDLNAV